MQPQLPEHCIPRTRTLPGPAESACVHVGRRVRRIGRIALVLALTLSWLPSQASAQFYEGLPTIVAPSQPLEVEAKYFSGQTFVTWREIKQIKGESYRIYRSTRKITAKNLPGAQLLYEVPEGSSTFWSDYYPCSTGCAIPVENWEPRFSATMPVPTGRGDQSKPADYDQGMFVWTIGPNDIMNGAFRYHYAVTTVSASGQENRLLFSDSNRAMTPLETVESPRPVKLQETVNPAGVRQHVYVQYMDLRTWNPTLQAPNAVHQDYGQDLSDPKVANAISYAFSYVVLEPPAPQDTPLPVILKLHPFLRDILDAGKFIAAVPNFQVEENYDYPAIEIRPIDVGSTWWFGFADQSFDYRAYENSIVAINAMAVAAPPVRNYTEARVLRMIYDISRDTDYWAGKVDPERIYVIGHSMGGGGAIALALRYPKVFASAHATAAVTSFYDLVDPDAACVTPIPQSPDCPLGFQFELAYDVALKWGPPGVGRDPFKHIYPSVGEFSNPDGHEQPVIIDGPASWAQHLTKFDGTHVYDWQDHLTRLGSPPAKEVVPINVHHSSSDAVVNWKYQGRPIYERLNDGNYAWSGLVEDFVPHLNPFWFLGLSPNFADIPGEGPFFGLTAVLSETIPSIHLNPNRAAWLIPVPSPGIYFYNTQIVPGLGFGAALEWSASWYPWDGPPKDTQSEWRMSIRTVDGSRQVVDISPRRTQAFKVIAGQTYNWTVTKIDGTSVECGCLIADSRGVITLPNVTISGQGRRISIHAGIDPNCKPCITEPSVEPVLPVAPKAPKTRGLSGF